jgi:16S rRNA (adenine1518-N6/adenine1519-N6)-dimethyltransferase
VATLQLEVVQRIVAPRGGDHYGILTLLLQVHYEPHDWFKIPPGSFFPEPDVDSACVVLIRRPEPLLDETKAAVFVRLVKRAFSQRRKMMLKLLKQDWTAEKLVATFEHTGISPQIRAEQVTLEQFVALTNLLTQ